MTDAYVSLGSNEGDREAMLRFALTALARTRGVDRVEMSSVYETEPVGPPPQGHYLNAVVAIATQLGPRALLRELLAIERRAGRDRTRGPRWGARPLDLDLLLYGERVVDEPGLCVPHARLHERAFVLEPLAELAGGLRHPRLGSTVAALAAARHDPAAVRRVGPPLRAPRAGPGLASDPPGWAAAPRGS